MTTKNLKNIAEAIPFFCMVFIVRLLPRIPALKMGRFLGRISRYFLPKRVATTFENLQRAYPDHDTAWVRQQVRQVFEHLGISGVEMLRIDRFNSQAQIDKHFTFFGLEHLEKLKTEKTSAFILTAHIGFWESGTVVMPTLGFPLDFVTKTIRNPYIDRFFRRQRESTGGHCLDSKHGARRIIRALANKRLVCILLDQHISKKQAVIVNFFGRPAYATPIIPQIALKTKTPIIPSFVYRQADFSYRVVIEPPLIFAEEITPEAIQRCTQQLTDIVETAIRKQPDQWFWVHRRWRKSAERK
jgi:KDO2-lipid IV(A) lauroyltransferase